MSTQLNAATHGALGFEVAYTLVLVAIVVGPRANRRHLSLFASGYDRKEPSIPAAPGVYCFCRTQQVRSRRYAQ